MATSLTVFGGHVARDLPFDLLVLLLDKYLGLVSRWLSRIVLYNFKMA